MTIHIQRILVPTDFSKYSATATRYASELATQYNAELHLLHTLEILPAFRPELAAGFDFPAYVNALKADTEKSLTSLLDPQWAAGRKVFHAIIEGSARVEIFRYAKQNDIDLIVLSTHGRTATAHTMMGSVAESVVRTAPCPVLTVRPEGHQFVTM